MSRKIATPDPVITHATDTEPVGNAQYRVNLRSVTIAVGTTSGGFWRDGKGQLHRACGKCNSTGFIPHYAGLYGGVCFDCGGTGTGKKFADETAAVKATRANYLAAQRATRKAAEQAAAREAADAAWRVANPELVASLSAVITDDDVTRYEYSGGRPAGMDAALFDFARTVRSGRALTDAQTEFAANLLDQHAAELAHRATKRYGAPVDAKVTVTGTVVTALTTEPGRYGSSRLVVIEGTGDDEGVTAKMFTSAEWAWKVDRDDTLTVTATVKKHDEYDGIPQTVLARPKRIA